MLGEITALDSDGDGLNDEDELRYGTDPHKADTDGDGLNDWEEINVRAYEFPANSPSWFFHLFNNANFKGRREALHPPPLCSTGSKRHAPVHQFTYPTRTRTHSY